MKVENKKAKFDYEIVEATEVGVQLTGAEVKSIKTGGASLTGARVVIIDGEAFLVGMQIQKYRFDSSLDYKIDRTRKILIKRAELISLGTKMKSSGLTLVPIKLYNKGSLIKLEIALVRGKKKFEKRELIKKRETRLALARRLKNNQ